ncbi:MAG: aspartate-semialdehyde dehydrogenase [Candidatus Melainabacteria bacterium]|nr:aspartate-semialdehyde dehydrogenase [Candidatus Melainabacteria bacterium]
MKKELKVAILGATGRVGQELISVLEQRNFPVSELIALASARSANTFVEWKGKKVEVKEPTDEIFKNCDLVLASAGGSVSKEWGPRAVKQGCVFIDNSSTFRMDKDVPLIVPEVNAKELANHNGLIANPNCSTIQLVVVLKELHDLAGLKRVVVSTYQSVSGAGKEAIDELHAQTKEVLAGNEAKPEVFKRPIAFNLIPQIDVFSEDGYTFEEIKVINESRKILGLPELAITCTAVRVPVVIGHSESVTVDLEKQVSLDQIKEKLKTNESIELWDDWSKAHFPTPVDCAGKDPVYVGRIRKDTSSPNGINMWVVADNLRIGAALNAVRIAEYLLAHDLMETKKVLA